MSLGSIFHPALCPRKPVLPLQVAPAVPGFLLVLPMGVLLGRRRQEISRKSVSPALLPPLHPRHPRAFVSLGWPWF